MKLGLLTALIFLAGCAAPRPYPPRPVDRRNTNYESTNVIIENRSPNSIRQDAYECEREAALSSVAGGKAEAFNSCMRSRGHTP